MFFDPTCKPEVKPDTFSLAGLVEWLEKQPRAQSYDWADIDGCVVCNYLRAVTGIQDPAAHIGWPNGTHGFGSDTFGPNWGYFEICKTEPHTYGAALARARAML